MKSANWKQLLEWLDKTGWDEGIKLLEKEHYRVENMAAFYWSDPATYSAAKRLQPLILQQAETLARLYIMNQKRKEANVAAASI